MPQVSPMVAAYFFRKWKEVWRTSAGPSVTLAEFAKDTPKEPEVALSRGRGEDGC